MEPGMSAEEVFEKNQELIREIGEAFVGSSTLFVVASEPIDLMTAALRRELDVPASRVLGIAGVIDSFRLRHALGSALEVGPDYITGHVIGPSTHEAQIIWEFTSINGVPATEVADKSVIADIEKSFAEESEERLKRLTESFSRYAPAAAAFDLLRAIVKDDRRIITVTMEWTNMLGISDVAMSVPSVIGRFGADRVELPTLDAGAVSKLQTSAEQLKSILAKHVEQQA
jgi:malate/lactate dehydrogenase